VALVIKSTIRQASTANRKAFDAFKARACKDPRIILVEDTLSRDDNASLYMCSDAYISLHRAEGFGLTMAEAMGYGKPTIGTGYSGNLDFMNTDNACLVRYDKVEMDAKDYHNQQSEWADPDTDDAAQYMRRVYSDIPFREKIARAGQRMIHEKFSRIAVGRKLLKRLQEIHEERS
jgi:glycosyltransferase involved in cell wall biosynthesis